MSDLSPKDTQGKAIVDEYAISELERFFLLLDKWDREAKGETVEYGATGSVGCVGDGR